MQIPANVTGPEFIRFMERVWEDAGELYERWFDAKKTMRHYGGKRVASGNHKGESWYTYLLPCGDRVAINARGTAVRIPNLYVRKRAA